MNNNQLNLAPASKLPNFKHLDIAANVAYKEYLLRITRIIGTDQETYNTQLDKLCRYLFEDLFLGVFAHDKVPKITTGKYCIVNLDDHDQPGSHWVGMADNMVYDSFGRVLDFKLYKRTDSDAEQTVDENNCGQRSVAWLCVYHAMGAMAAMQI